MSKDTAMTDDEQDALSAIHCLIHRRIRKDVLQARPDHPDLVEEYCEESSNQDGWEWHLKYESMEAIFEDLDRFITYVKDGR